MLSFVIGQVLDLLSALYTMLCFRFSFFVGYQMI